jgi:hypothetical protein
MQGCMGFNILSRHFVRQTTWALPFTQIVLSSSNMDGDDRIWKPYYRQSHSPDQQIGELDDPASRHILKAKPGTRSLRDTYLKHTCARCGKARSQRHQDEHHHVPGEEPIRGICLRPECARYTSQNGVRELSKKKPQPQVIVLEFHHYLHTGISGNRPSSSIATAVELPAAEKTWKELSGEYPYTSSYDCKLFPTLEEQPAPRVNLHSKPTLVHC